MKFFKPATIMFLIIMLAGFFISPKALFAMDKGCTSNIYNNPRVIILTGKPKNIDEQIELFEADKQTMNNREIVVLRPQETTEHTQENFNVVNDLSHVDFIPKDLSPYRHYFDSKDKMDADFTMRLIGKDMTQKQQWDAPINFEEIKILIDKMPMRQRQMGK